MPKILPTKFDIVSVNRTMFLISVIDEVHDQIICTEIGMEVQQELEFSYRNFLSRFQWDHVDNCWRG